ncbi:hypothetical protein INR49_005854 [Caranx melampygus]|nr:hypothetical protein INR49_005854 [Caranx melampygus]
MKHNATAAPCRSNNPHPHPSSHLFSILWRKRLLYTVKQQGEHGSKNHTRVYDTINVINQIRSYFVSTGERHRDLFPQTECSPHIREQSMKEGLVSVERKKRGRRECAALLLRSLECVTGSLT